MEYLHTGERIGYKRGHEEGEEFGVLRSKRQMIGRLLKHRFKLEAEAMEETIENRVALIQSENELDELIDLALMQPSLSSFMSYLPTLDR